MTRQKKSAVVALAGLALSAVATHIARRRRPAHSKPASGQTALAVAAIAVLQTLQNTRVMGAPDIAVDPMEPSDQAGPRELPSASPAVAPATEPTEHRGRHCRQATQGETRLVETIDRAFRENYLTLISIIQGVAFSFLAERAFNAQRPTTAQWIAFTICFMGIVAVWDEYMVGSTMFAWTPTLLDAVIPFAIGVTEFLLIAGVRLGTSSFLLRLAIFLAVGTAAYANWLFHARRGKTNQDAYKTLDSYIRFGTSYCAAVTVASLLAWELGAGTHFSDVWILAVTLGAVSPVFLHSVLTWNLRLHRIRRLVRGTETAIVIGEAPRKRY